MSRSLGKFAKAARSETGQKFHDNDAESARLRKSNEDRNVMGDNRQGIELSQYESKSTKKNDIIPSVLSGNIRETYIEKKCPSQTGV